MRPWCLGGFSKWAFWDSTAPAVPISVPGAVSQLRGGGFASESSALFKSLPSRS